MHNTARMHSAIGFESVPADHGVVPLPDGGHPEILRPGLNCWRISHANQVAFMTNADYFDRLARSLECANRRIVVIGWHLDAQLVLSPRSPGPEGRPLAEFIDWLAERRPGLQIYFLLWDRTIFYGGNRLSADALADLSARRTNVHFHYAPAPFVSSHHAKLIVIDDSLAFIGGIDLAGDRWDPEEHLPSDPARLTPAGESYGPIHDLQAAVAGPAAKSLGDYASGRWADCTGQILPPIEEGSWNCPAWPASLPIDFEDIVTGIARTEPDAPTGAIREIEALNKDALTAARRWIYLEAQYLTAEAIGDQLAARLEEEDGPEVVIVVTRTSHGYVEQFAMGNNRDRLLRRLQAADRFRRLRVYYPTGCDGVTKAEVKIHTKLVLIDDRLIRIGSSNLNNRSMAVDTECDIAFEAVNAQQRRRIRELRDRLIGCQLHVAPQLVAEAFEATSSLIEVIDRLNDAAYLEPLEVSLTDGPTEPMPGTALLDPNEPLTLGRLWSELGLGGTQPGQQFCGGEGQTAEEKGN